MYHERDVVNTLRKYITDESERLEEIKRQVEEYRVHNQEVLIIVFMKIEEKKFNNTMCLIDPPGRSRYLCSGKVTLMYTDITHLG